jgi:glycosyltransferase involved in cell wall biosynthesis
VRKNPLAVIAAEAIRRARGGEGLPIVVVGGMGDALRTAAKRFARRIGVPPADLSFLENVPKGELATLYANALVCVVPSFAEGFSLPVIEAVLRGTPVVASDIPAHAELLGRGWWLARPDDPAALADAIARAVQSPAPTAAEQRTHLGDKGDSAATAARLRAGIFGQTTRIAASQASGAPKPAPDDRSGRLRIAVATPWPPQRSGVADFSTRTLRALGELADVTVLTNTPAANPDPMVELRTISAAAYLDPAYDVVITILGNSHFHLPGLEYLTALGGPTIAHDNRMLEFYWHMRDVESVARLLSRPDRPVVPEEIGGFLVNINTLPDLAYREIARVAWPLILHAAHLAERVEQETGVAAKVLPFVPLRQPANGSIDDAARRAAKARCALADDAVHAVCFGFVDLRTKAADVVVGALAWLVRWGVPIRLHFVGGASPPLRQALERQAADFGVGHLIRFHDFADEASYCNMLVAADVAVQLRMSPLLTLSGALLDCVSFGVPTVTTQSLSHELGAPDYVVSVPDQFSPLLVAERILEVSRVRDGDRARVEAQRQAYVDARPPQRYARLLLEQLRSSRSDAGESLVVAADG